MKKKVKHRKFKNVFDSGRFYTRFLLFIIILSGIVFIKWTVSRDMMPLFSNEEFQKILECHVENPELLAKGKISLMLNGYKLPYDREKNIWYMAQNPEKNWEGTLGLNIDDAQIYLLDDGYIRKKEESIREGHLFQAIVIKGNEYALTNVVVSGMPVIAIETSGSWQPKYPIEDIDNYVFNSELRYLGDITIFYANGYSGTYRNPENNTKNVYRIVQAKVNYHIRGNTSKVLGKKSYAIKLMDKQGNEQKENLFGLGYNDSWKLLASAGDATKVREKTAWQLWEEIADRQQSVSERVSTMEYCEVVLDGDYIGMYQMLPSLNKDTLKLQDTDILYKFLSSEMPLEEDIQSSIDAGYVVCWPIRLRYPKKEAGNLAKQWEPMRQYLGAAYWYADFEKLYLLIDIENLTDYCIFLEAISGYDNACQNTYRIARKTKSEGGYSFLRFLGI